MRKSITPIYSTLYTMSPQPSSLNSIDFSSSTEYIEAIWLHRGNRYPTGMTIECCIVGWCHSIEASIEASIEGSIATLVVVTNNDMLSTM